MSDIVGSKAISLLHSGAITEVGAGVFTVPAFDGDTHTVELGAGVCYCTCEAGRHNRSCYHVRAVELWLARERRENGVVA